MKLVGLVLVTLSALAILSFSQATPVAATDVTKQIQTGLCAGSNLNLSGRCVKPSNSTKTLDKFIHNIVNVLSAIVGVVAVIMIIFGGFRYITSGGNDTSVTGAKNTILYAIIGLVIVALSQVIVHFVLRRITTS